jgi:flagellar assembly protein FliH
MAELRKYMFDLDFDQPRKRKVEEAAAQPLMVEDEPPPPPAAMFTEEELQIARDAAFEEGRLSGLQEAEELTERLTAMALQTLAGQVVSLFKRQEDANDANARNAVRVAQAVLRRVLPAACEQNAFEEVTRVVEEVIGHILDEPRIIVRVTQPLVEPVREKLEALALDHGFEGRVVVQPDTRLTASSDCRVEWTDGGAERDQARLLAQIEETIEQALAPPERRMADAPDESGS